MKQVISNDVGTYREADTGATNGVTGLFGQHHVVHEVRTRPTILFRNAAAQKAVLTCLAPERLGHDAVLFPLLDIGLELFTKKAAGIFAKQLMVAAIDGTILHSFYPLNEYRPGTPDSFLPLRKR